MVGACDDDSEGWGCKRCALALAVVKNKSSRTRAAIAGGVERGEWRTGSKAHICNAHIVGRVRNAIVARVAVHQLRTRIDGLVLRKHKSHHKQDAESHAQQGEHGL